MMSIGSVKSAGSAGNYYTDKDNYYVIGSMDERWQGKGAEALGIDGKAVDKALFTELLKGKLPDGSDLTRIQDGANKHRPGYDLTFSAPKSVSVMAMLGGDKRLIDAHNQAVTEAVRQLETLAATRVMTDGKSETVLTGNLIVAKFNHDTNRNQEPQIHTHAVVINATQNGDKWQSLGTDKIGKTGFIESVYANQIAFGKLYREAFKPLVEKLGYETEVVGKHGMWEMKGVPVEPFSTRSQEVREAAGPDASLKSRDVAALDTRKSKEAIDPAEKMVEWMNTLKETGFDIRGYREAADARAAELARAPAAPVNTDGPDITDVVTKAITGLSDRKVQFTYADLLARTVGQLEAKDGVFELARKGIDAAIEREQLIPLDREKGLFTSNIHVLDELAVKALSQEVQRQNHVSVTPDASVVRQVPFSDAVSVLAQDRPVMGIVSGQGGATGQRERVAELTLMAREQERDVHILAADSPPDGPRAGQSDDGPDRRTAGGDPDDSGKHGPVHGGSGVCRGGENHPVPGSHECHQSAAGRDPSARHRSGADASRGRGNAECRRGRAHDGVVPPRHAAAAAQWPDTRFQQHPVPARREFDGGVVRHGESPEPDCGRGRSLSAQRRYRPAAVHFPGPAVQADAATQRRRRCHHERDCAPGA